MARVNINGNAVRAAAVSSPGYHSFAREKARELRTTASEVYRSRQVTHNAHRTSETTPPKYLQSFEIRRDGDDWFLVNIDRAAMWVEFGALAGGHTQVLRYRPLTTALEIVGNSVSRDRGDHD